MQKTVIQKAIDDAGGIRAVSEAVGRTYEAIRKLYNRGHLPASEFSGRTQYAEVIASMNGCNYSADFLLKNHHQVAVDRAG